MGTQKYLDILVCYKAYIFKTYSSSVGIFSYKQNRARFLSYAGTTFVAVLTLNEKRL